MSQFVYSIDSDFGGSVKTAQLQKEISIQLGSILKIDTLGDVLTINFSTPLNGSEQDTLSSIISLHNSFENIEEIIVDSQLKTSTTSIQYVDIYNTSFVTQHEDVSDYIIQFNGIVETKNSRKDAYFIINVDNIDILETESNYKLLKDSIIPVQLIYKVQNVSNSSIIKVRWKTTSGNTLTIYNRTLSIKKI